MTRVSSSAAQQSRSQQRRGLALLASLVALAVAAAVLFALLRSTAGQHRQVDMLIYQEQARWLAESGVEKAAASIAVDTDYRGEEWTVSAEQMGADSAGMVSITVTPNTEEPMRYAIRSQASFPSGSPTPARYTVELTLQAGEKPAASQSPSNTN